MKGDATGAAKRPGRVRAALLGGPGRIALSLALVAYLASGMDWRRVLQTLVAADRLLIAGALVPLALIPPLAAERWRAACLALCIRRSRRFFVPATYAAMFAGQFLPSGIGVDAVRLALSWRQDIPLRGGVQAVAIDRIAGVGALLVLMYAGLPFALGLLPPGAATPIAGMTALAAAACALAIFVDRLPLPPWLRSGWAGRLLSLVADTRAALGTPQALAALGCGIAAHLLSVCAVLLLAQAFGYGLRFPDLLTLIAVAIFAAMLPISFNGWGVREGAMMLGLSLLAVPRETAVMISFVYGIGGALCALPGSITWLHLRRAPPPPAGDATRPSPAAGRPGSRRRTSSS